MNALDELKNKLRAGGGRSLTALELAVLFAREITVAEHERAAAELAALRARVGELEQERDELNKIIPFVLRHYDDIDDEFTESFYVNADYKIVDPSKTDEWKYLLTLKQIANRRLEKLSAALAKGAK